MALEINNSRIYNQPNVSTGDEAQSARVAERANQRQLESGKPVETVTEKDNAIQLDRLVKDLSKSPPVDTQRVENIRQKIARRELDILSDNPSKRLEAALNVAKKISSLEKELPNRE
ncbi:MAG: hypothetical protein ACKOAD_04420 [Gammaproteobacteria bacterium]